MTWNIFRNICAKITNNNSKQFIFITEYIGLLKPGERREIIVSSKINYTEPFISQIEVSINWEEISGTKFKNTFKINFEQQEGDIPWEDLRRQKPYSIVLFDEIEKAHKSVFDVFLQILDEGKLHDRLGKEGDFSNSVILFTSNIGSDFIVKSFEKDVIPKSNDLIQLMTGYFRPEFLNRVDDIILFDILSRESIEKIVEIQVHTIIERLRS